MELQSTPIPPQEHLTLLRSDSAAPAIAANHKLWEALNRAISTLEKIEAEIKSRS